MSRLAFMFQVLKAMYKEDSLDVSYLYSSSNPYKAGGPSSLLYMFVPSVNTSVEIFSSLSQFSFAGVGVQTSNLLASLNTLVGPSFTSVL